MGDGMYDYNLLVSCSWSAHREASREIVCILGMLDDDNPVVKRTVAKGIIGVKTCLNTREVTRKLEALSAKGSLIVRHALKWVPVDLWTSADMDSMKEAVAGLRVRIDAGERWRITLEKRRYTRYHKAEIIEELADLIDERVDLTNPDKILRVDIIGRYAGMSVLTSKDVFSLKNPFFVKYICFH